MELKKGIENLALFVVFNSIFPRLAGTLTYLHILTVKNGTSCLGGGWVVRRCWVHFQCQGALLTWLTVGQGPIVLSVGAGGGCLDIFLSSITSLFFLPLPGR